MERVVEREIVWVRDKKAPKLKFDDLDFDVLVVRVSGDDDSILRFTVDDVRRIGHEYESPRHYVFKIIPHLMKRMYGITEQDLLPKSPPKLRFVRRVREGD